jgi:hypothetical protein
LTNTTHGIYMTPAVSDAPRYATIANNTIAGNLDYGIFLAGRGVYNTSDTYGNTIRGNKIGVAPNGTSAKNGHGIYISNAYLNFIGGTSSSDRNIISGNKFNGIWITGSQYIGILGNYIGTNVAGTAAMPNLAAGVRIDGGHDNIVGGAIYGIFPATNGNVVSGNGSDGVKLVSGTHDNLVLANYIGRNAANTGNIPNTLSGVSMLDGAQNNIIGGDVITSLNIIAGNGTYGVYLSDNSTRFNVVKYNDILNNGSDGVTLQNGANSNTIGGDTPYDFNLIRYNYGSGISIASANANTVKSNGIVGNQYYGVLLDGASTTGNLITSTAILQNGYDGIGERNSASFNVWSHVSIYDNVGLGVDKFANFGGTANIVDAPNAVITSVVKAGSVITVSGTGLNGTLIELYRVAPDPSGFGEGKTFVGSTGVSSGKWKIVDTSGSSGCYTLFENSLGISASEFGPNNCRNFLPLVLKNH